MSTCSGSSFQWRTFAWIGQSALERCSLRTCLALQGSQKGGLTCTRKQIIAMNDSGFCSLRVFAFPLASRLVQQALNPVTLLPKDGSCLDLEVPSKAQIACHAGPTLASRRCRAAQDHACVHAIWNMQLWSTLSNSAKLTDFDWLKTEISQWPSNCKCKLFQHCSCQWPTVPMSMTETHKHDVPEWLSILKVLSRHVALQESLARPRSFQKQLWGKTVYVASCQRWTESCWWSAMDCMRLAIDFICLWFKYQT